MSWITDLLDKMKVTRPGDPSPSISGAATDQVIAQVKKQQYLDNLPKVYVDDGFVYIPKDTHNTLISEGLGNTGAGQAGPNTLPTQALFGSGGVTYGGVTYPDYYSYTKKQAQLKGTAAQDPLGLNTAAGKPVVQYVQSTPTVPAWLPQPTTSINGIQGMSNSSIIFENGKPKKVITGTGPFELGPFVVVSTD